MAEEINPLTGLPYTKAEDINPLTGEAYTVRPASDNVFAGTRSMVGGFDDYKGTYFSPETEVDPFTDMEEQRARNQSNWDKWGNGLAKAGLTFTGAVSENTAGYVLGLADYALSGFEDFEESMTNNPVGQFFDEANEHAREHLPNYQTNEERAEQGTLAQLGNANFWADTFANGAAYSLGSIASMYLTGGVGALGAVGRAVGAGAKISKGLAGYRAVKAIQNGMAPIEAMRKASQLRSGVRAGSKALGYLEGGAMMSIAESAVEARETERTVRDELIGDYMMRYGVEDQNMIPSPDMQDIEQTARLLSNQVFDANMAVLMPTNLLQFHGMLRPMQLGSNVIHGTKFIKEGGKKVLRDNLDALPGWAARGGKFARTYLKPTVGGFATESFQESAQYALSQGAVGVAKDAAEEAESGSVSIYEALTNGRKNKAEMLNIAERGAPQITTPEGREQAMVGGLVGLLTGGIGGVKTARAKDARTKEALEYFKNLDSSLNLKTAGRENKQAERYYRQMEVAEAAGDVQAYDDARFGLLRTLAFEHAKRGTFDAFIERLEDAKELSPDEFESLFGVDSYSKKFRGKTSTGMMGEFVSREQQQRDRVDEIISRAQETKDMFEQVQEMYPPVSPKGALLKGFTRMVGGKERLEELRQQDEDTDLYKRAMVYAATQSKHAEARLEKDFARLAALDPELNIEELRDVQRKTLAEIFFEDPQSSEESVRRVLETELYEKTFESYKRAVENDPTKAAEAASLVESIRTLMEDRNTATLAYQNLDRSPEARDLFVSRQKAEETRQEQLRIDKQADDVITNTERVDDIKAALKNLPEDVSPSARKRVVEAKNERVAQRNTFLSKYRRMEPEAVSAIDPTTVEDALEREALEIDQADIKSGKRTKAVGKKSKKGETKTTRDSNRRNRKKEAGNSQDTSSSVNQRGSARKAAVREGQENEIVTQTTNPETGKKSGQFQLVPGTDIVLVNDKGVPVAGEFGDTQTVDGVSVLDGRELLADPEIGAGTKATIEIVETDWWNTKATEEEKNDPVANIPMFVVINGKRVGLLKSGKTAIREAVFQGEEFTGETVEVTIAEKYASNVNNTEVVGELGARTNTKFFYNPVEALGNPAVGVVTIGPDGSNKFTVPQGDLSNEVYEEIEKSIIERMPKGVVPGQVFFVVPHPNGGYMPIMGQTATLSSAVQGEVIDAMTRSDQEAQNLLQGLVGSNVLYTIEGLGDSRTPKILISKQAGDVVLHTFNAVDENGNLDQSVSKDGKMLIRVSNKTLDKVMNGEKLTFDDLTEVEQATLLVEPTVVIGETGAELTNEVGVALDNRAAADYAIKNLEKLVRNVVKAKRYQVSQDSLNTNGDFVDPFGNVVKAKDGVGGHMQYLTRLEPGVSRTGHNGILSSNVRTVNGTAFHDIGLRLSGEFTVDGSVQKANDAVQETVPQTQPSKNSSTTPDPSNPFDGLGDLTGTDDSGFDPNSIPDPQGDPTAGDRVVEDGEIDEDGNITFSETTNRQTLDDLTAAIEGTIDQLSDAEEAGDRAQLSEEIDEMKSEWTRLTGLEYPNLPDAPFRLRPESSQVLNEQQAKAWLRERNIPVEMYEQVMRIGNGVAHGYMENATVHLWTQAEVGTEYHEGFHYVFRTLLNDKQRNALYKEAAKRYNLTQEELNSLKGLNPDLALEQLRELGLEERMAEDFRDYVMTVEETSKTLPGKIRKFFKDLYNFIKALFIDPVSIRQLYSLIESNNIPKSYLRNTQKFTTKASAFAYVPLVGNRDTHKDITLSLSTRFIEAFNAKRAQVGRDLTQAEYAQLLGSKDNKGSVAEALLRDSVRYKDTGLKLNTQDFVTLKQALAAGESFGSTINSLGAIPMPPSDTGLPDSLLKNMSNENQYKTALVFKSLYENWEDNVSREGLDNIESYGFRSAMIQDLERFGFTIRYQQLNNKEDLQNKNREDEFDEISQFDKVYALSSIEQNPMDSLSGETKRILSTIKSEKPNFLGLYTYVDVNHVVRLIVPAAADNTRLDDIVEAIRVKSLEFPELIPVVDALNNEFTPQQRALFKRTFANTYNRLRILEESFDDDNNKSSRIIDSNRKDAARAAVDEWNRGGIQKVIQKDNAPLRVTDEGKLVVNEEFGEGIEEGLQGQNRIDLLVGSYRNLKDRTLNINERIEAMADVMYYLGMNLGKDRAQSRYRLKRYLDQGTDPTLAFNRLLAGDNRIQLDKMLGSIVDIKMDKNGIPIGKYSVKETPSNYFLKESSSVRAAAEIKKMFEVPLAMSIVNGAGKAVYPYNLQTPMSSIVEQMQNEEIGEDEKNVLKMMEKDEFFHTMGIGQYQSILMRLGESNKFAIEAFSLDVFKVEDDEVSATEYKDTSARESLLVRLDAYANNGNTNLAVYAVPTQEGRGRMDFLVMPRFGNTKALKAAGLQDINGHRAAIKGFIVQDLIRINRDEKIIESGENLIEDYHTGLETYRTFQLSGVEDKLVDNEKLSEMIDAGALDMEGTPEFDRFHQEVDKMVDDYLNKQVSQRVNELKERIDKYNLNVEGKSRLSTENIKKLGGMDQFLRNFVIDDTIARLEMAKVFRGGIATAKNVTDFYKRMGLVNTPGNIFMMQGEDMSNPEFGMLNEFNQMAIEDVVSVEKIHDDIAKKYQELLESQGVEKAKAKLIADQYKTGMAKATDAQAFISPQMWRAIKQGEGTWTDEMDQMWKKWEKGGKWSFGYTEPFKMYYEDQKSVPFTVKNKDGSLETIYKYVTDMDKNSYHVLTPDFVGKPGKVPTLIQQMYQKMQDENIHVINTVSAKKGAKQNIFKVDETREKGLFNGAVVTKQKGSSLRKPQTINDKAFDIVRLSRQLRKNGINLVQRGEKYVLNAGIPGLEREMTGQQLLDTYHNSFEVMLQTQMNELKAEMGYTKLQEAQQSGDPKAIQDARVEVYKKLRDLFLKENIKRDRLDENTERQLQLVFEDGIVDFAIPLGMPAYVDKYQNLFFSLFKNRVLKTMMPGKEVVQVASPGKYDVFNFDTKEYEQRELRYLDVEVGEDGSRIVHAEVLISAPIAKRLGLKPGDDLSTVPEELLRALGYRIPHQGKSSTLMMRVAGILPKSYNKSIVVPGNITVMMGSDFDVDKMFVMFPEFAKASELSGDLQKVTLDNYESLQAEAGQDLFMAAHKNNMLDVLEAVAAAPRHAEETLTPLATDALDDIIKKLPKKDVESLPFDHPLKELQMEENYKFAAQLVGVYATQLAGLSVAANGNQGRGVAVHEAREVIVNGTQHNIISGSKESFGILIEHLSGALDAGKKVIQPALNDNLLTATAKTYLYSLGVDPLLVTKMHRAPIVMDFVEKVNVQGLSPMAAFSELGLTSASVKAIKSLSLADGLTFKPTTTAEIDEVMTLEANEEGKYPKEAVDALRNFAVTFYAGKDMEKLFKAIVTDVADGIGDLGTLQVILESIESFDRGKGMFGSADVSQFLQGDAFGISKAFFSQFSEMLALTSDFFVGATPAFKQAKDNLIGLTDRGSSFSEEEHRMLDRQLFYMMMTKEGSPLKRFIGVSSQMKMVNPVNNLVTDLAAMRKRFPKEIGDNRFVMQLQEAPSNESEMNRVFNIQFENMDKMTTELKDEMIAAFEDILFSENEEIRKFGRKLVMNQLLTTGFTPGYGAYYDLIPARFFTTKVEEGDTQTPAQWARTQIREVQQNPSYFSPLELVELLRSVGTRRTKGKLFMDVKTVAGREAFKSEGSQSTVDIVKLTDFDGTTIDGPVVILAKKPGKSKVDKYQMFMRRAKGQYVALNQKSLTGQLNEINSGANSALVDSPGSNELRKGLDPNQILHVEGGTIEMIKDVFANTAKDTNLRTISSDQNDKRIVSKKCN
tara:strand:- start:6168 stop:17684 length:11517 start_codon:yes stop_codon:yes gene_type:complete